MIYVKQQQAPDEPRFILSEDDRFVARMDEGTDAEWELLRCAPTLLALVEDFMEGFTVRSQEDEALMARARKMCNLIYFKPSRVSN